VVANVNTEGAWQGSACPRVLVIDDDAELRSTLGETLTAAGYTVLLAADGDEAAPYFENIPPDVVVTDIFMPNKDGLDVIVDLRKAFPWVRVIAMSGNPSKENLLHTASLIGAVETIAKPFLPNRLLTAVRTVLQD